MLIMTKPMLIMKNTVWVKNKEAYAFFEKTDVSRNYKALALGEISIGHIGWAGVDDKKGIWFNMEKMKLESLNKWANDSVFLRRRLTLLVIFLVNCLLCSITVVQ